jgi:putative hydrolase of the HAD superfamily
MKTILLDFGNVIGFFDHMKAVESLSRYSPIPADQLERLLYGGPEEDAYESGKISTDQYVDFAMSAGRFTCSRQTFLDHFAEIFTPNPEICRIIPELARNYRLVLASNTNDAHYRKYCRQFARELEYFSARCPSHEIGTRKPKEAYYRATHVAVNAEPHECLFLDDLERNTRAAEASVGWKTLVYQPGQGILRQLRELGIAIGEPGS